METNEQVSLAPPERATRSAQFYSGVHRWRTLVKRLWWIPFLTVSLALSIQGFLLWNAPPLYISVGRMLVAPQLQYNQEAKYMEEYSNFIGTQQALMQSGEVQRRAIELLQRIHPELARVPVKLLVGVTPKTTIFVFQATGGEPQYTRAFLQGCMEAYTNLKKEMRAESTETTLAGITEELGKLERQLRADEDELAAFPASNQIVISLVQNNSEQTYLGEKRRELQDLRAQYQLLTSLTLDQNLTQARTAPGNNSDPAGNADPLQANDEFLKAKQQLQMLKLEWQERTNVWKPKHPKMVELEGRIARSEALLDFSQKQTLEQLASRRAALSISITNLEQLVKDLDAKALDTSAKMAQYEKIKARYTRNQGTYEKWSSLTKTLDVQKKVTQESVTIHEPASQSEEYKGNLVKALLIAGFVGLAAGVGILLLINRLDDRLNSYTELKSEFDEEVLGQIPRDREARRGGASQLIRREDERHAFMEAYRNLRSSLHYLDRGSEPRKTLLVTSSIPNDGKSMTTANLAITTALAGSRVLLVDADLRKGVLHQRFGLQGGGEGLSEVLADGHPWQPHVQATAIPNLFLLPRGATTQHSSELFLSPAAPAFLRDSAAQYDYVIIDSAPVMAADDVTSLAPHVDGVLFVIRAQRTSARVAHAALELLYQRHVNVLGIVFNAVEANVSEYYYYKYRDYYAAYPAK